MTANNLEMQGLAAADSFHSAGKFDKFITMNLHASYKYFDGNCFKNL